MIPEQGYDAYMAEQFADQEAAARQAESDAGEAEAEALNAEGAHPMTHQPNTPKQPKDVGEEIRRYKEQDAQTNEDFAYAAEPLTPEQPKREAWERAKEVGPMVQGLVESAYQEGYASGHKDGVSDTLSTQQAELERVKEQLKDRTADWEYVRKQKDEIVALRDKETAELDRVKAELAAVREVAREALNEPGFASAETLAKLDALLK